MNVQEFAAKYESKREVYNFLASAVGAYLAGYENVSIYFLRDIVSGKKKCKFAATSNEPCTVIKAAESKHIFVPFYEELTVKAILEECKRYQKVASYLPDGPDIARVTR